jgi:hypothetical protein
MFAVDLMQRALPVREPHPRSFDELAGLLSAHAIDMRALTQYQWALLDEAGHKPDLDAPATAAVLHFLPESGRFEVDRPAGGGAAWPVRGRTLAALRSITRHDGPQTPASDDSWTRSAAFLCAYWMWVLGRPIPAAKAVFGDRIEVGE